MLDRLVPFLLLFAVAPLALAQSPTTVIVVRHAEVESGDDPSLSGPGKLRADALAKAVAGAGVDAIYVTQFKRTRETAAVVAEGQSVDITQLDVSREAMDEYAPMLAQRIQQTHAGQTVLVVGHSNTVPAIVKALSGQAADAIPHEEYSRMYVVVLAPGGETQVIAARYGN